jgi:hypothetical protein
VPVSLLNPEGKIFVFYGSFGVTANFAMVPRFEEIREKIDKGIGKMGGAGEFRLMTTRHARSSLILSLYFVVSCRLG